MLNGKYAKILPGVLKKKSKKQHPTKQQLYGNLYPISRTFKKAKLNILGTGEEELTNS